MARMYPATFACTSTSWNGLNSPEMTSALAISRRSTETTAAGSAPSALPARLLSSASVGVRAIHHHAAKANTTTATTAIHNLLFVMDTYRIFRMGPMQNVTASRGFELSFFPGLIPNDQPTAGGGRNHKLPIEKYWVGTGSLESSRSANGLGCGRSKLAKSGSATSAIVTAS